MFPPKASWIHRTRTPRDIFTKPLRKKCGSCVLPQPDSSEGQSVPHRRGEPFDTLELPRALRARDQCTASRDHGTEPHFITLTTIQRITFTRSLTPQESLALDHSNWAELGDSMCWLVGRLECGWEWCLKLSTSRRGGELGFEECLPRFYWKREAGGGWG